jgi:monothiol glutaredoxin
MSIDKERFDALVKKDKVVLFMKGSRHFPQCGFSSQVVQILNQLVPKYETVNILQDQTIREGMKEYSQWPTFPQLYVDGEFVGGCDIVKEMFASGELQQLIGAAKPAAPAGPAKVPNITITEGATKAFLAAAEQAPEDVLRLEVSPAYQYDLYFGPKAAGDVVAKSGELAVHMDPESASRADGLSVDFVQGPSGAGFKISSPHEPPRVKPLSAKELKAMLDKGEKLELIDVRGEDERKLAKIDAAKPFDPAALAKLDRNAKLVFHCHHGVRSRNAAEQVLREGFKNVYNLEGGIEAWSQVDPSVPRY